MQLRVEYTYDPESENWSFRVPSLGIIGGADTREAAEQAAIDAVAFVLEGEPDATDATEGEVDYLKLAIQR
jgi:predicted RNase H-like HicB family nuclease